MTDAIPVHPESDPSSYFAWGISGYRPLVSERTPDTRSLELSGEVLEVTICWGETVLAVHAASADRPVYLGNGRAPRGARALPLPALVEDELLLEVDEIEGSGRLRLELGALTIYLTRSVRLARPASSPMDPEAAAYFGLSVVATGAFLAALAFFVPSLGLTDDETLDAERLYVLGAYLSASAERERATEESTWNEARAEGGDAGERARAEPGALGSRLSTQKNRRYAVEKRTDQPELSKSRALDEAKTFGLIAVLEGDPLAPRAPWATTSASGFDPLSADGALYGVTLGEVAGAGGLELANLDGGSGGLGSAIGLGDIGDLGPGLLGKDGFGFGPHDGDGFGRGRTRPGHATRAPRMRSGPVVTNGRIPPEAIQRTVRQNFGRFRMCFERGLARNPTLEGRVSVRFVINREGAVESASNGASDLPDSGVVGCVVAQFYALGFPKPDGGIVTVVYPLMFTPG